MANTPLTPDNYFAGLEPAAAKVLARLRRLLQRALPGAEEVISYQMPAFRLHGRIVIYYAAWQEHYAIYPAGPVPPEFQEDLAPYVHGKGTLRFALNAPIPSKLITALAKHRAAAALAKSTKKPKPRTKPTRPSAG